MVSSFFNYFCKQVNRIHLSCTVESRGRWNCYGYYSFFRFLVLSLSFLVLPASFFHQINAHQSLLIYPAASQASAGMLAVANNLLNTSIYIDALDRLVINSFKHLISHSALSIQSKIIMSRQANGTTCVYAIPLIPTRDIVTSTKPQHHLLLYSPILSDNFASKVILEQFHELIGSIPPSSVQFSARPPHVCTCIEPAISSLA